MFHKKTRLSVVYVTCLAAVVGLFGYAWIMGRQSSHDSDVPRVSSLVPLDVEGLEKIELKIMKEPSYRCKSPKYCLLVFGRDARTRIWLVLDEDRLYVDRNGNGDLTEPNECVSLTKARKGLFSWTPPHFQVGHIVEQDGTEHKDLQVQIGEDIEDFLRIEVRLEGTRKQFVYHDAEGQIQFADRVSAAPVVHFNGPLTISFESFTNGQLRTRIGTKGRGSGTFAALDVDSVPKGAHPKASLEFPSEDSSRIISAEAILNRRC